MMQILLAVLVLEVCDHHNHLVLSGCDFGSETDLAELRNNQQNSPNSG
jgi:hypothetical protein